MNIRGVEITYWPWPQEKPFDKGYYGWGAVYNAVFLETNTGKLHRRIAKAKSVMQTRLQETERFAGDSSETRVLRNALRMLGRIALSNNLDHKTKTKTHRRMESD